MRLDTLAALNAERAARRAAILVTDLDSGEQRLVRAGLARAQEAIDSGAAEKLLARWARFTQQL